MIRFVIFLIWKLTTQEAIRVELCEVLLAERRYFTIPRANHILCPLNVILIRGKQYNVYDGA